MNININIIYIYIHTHTHIITMKYNNLYTKMCVYIFIIIYTYMHNYHLPKLFI